MIAMSDAVVAIFKSCFVVYADLEGPVALVSSMRVNPGGEPCAVNLAAYCVPGSACA